MVSHQIAPAMGNLQNHQFRLVLPRFDVQIVPPNYVTKDQANIRIKFLAK